jgi:hypothetical protein
MKKCLVAIAAGVDDEDAVGEATRYTLTSLAFQDHRDWQGNPS